MAKPPSAPLSWLTLAVALFAVAIRTFLARLVGFALPWWVMAGLTAITLASRCVEATALVLFARRPARKTSTPGI